jgi:hypothetical protein
MLSFCGIDVSKEARRRVGTQWLGTLPVVITPCRQFEQFSGTTISRVSCPIEATDWVRAIAEQNLNQSKAAFEDLLTIARNAVRGVTSGTGSSSSRSRKRINDMRSRIRYSVRSSREALAQAGLKRARYGKFTAEDRKITCGSRGSANCRRATESAGSYHG